MTSRRRRERREKRAQDTQTQQRNIWIVLGVVAVVVAAILIINASARKPLTAEQITEGSDPCELFPVFTGTETAPPPLVIDTAAQYRAYILTAKGEMLVDLYADKAPQTVNNFMFLACNHFYDGLSFHRVLPGFMAQGGDPAGDGSGGPGYTIPDEFALSDLSFDQPGLLSMAHTSEPNSAGSQFFITYSVEQTQHLSGAFTIFGKLHDDASLEVANKLTLRDPDDPSSASIIPDTMDTIVIRQVN